jgi:hypothetical protein
MFLGFSTEAKSIKKKLKSKKLKAGARKKLLARQKLIKALGAAGGPACKEPDFLSLKEYQGPWGEKQVRRLLEVFALGGRESAVGSYVGAGLDATVKDLLTIKEDSYADSLIAKLSCDSDPDDGINDCYENGNINDYYVDGMISAINLRPIFSNNPVKYALYEWVMDQRAPADPRVLGNQNRWMFKDYLALVDRFVQSGDYKQYVFDYTNDSLGHKRWLSGDSNHAGILEAGNEDFGRELMELLTLGTVDKNNQPNYSDLDVLVASKILSGWNGATVKDSSNNDIRVIGYFPNLHASGSHTMFLGSQYQTTIADSGASNAEQLARAIFNSKGDQVAYETARRLWGRFISSKATPTAIERLAKLIKDNDFKLWPVMEKMMRSRAFYAPESEETILKTPYTLFATYARMTGIPVNNYNDIRGWLSDLGMLLGRPPTVFGFSYNNLLLSSDVYQLERSRNIFEYTMWQNLDELKEEYNWTPYSGLIAAIPPVGYPEDAVVDAMLKRMNVAHTTSAEQRAQYIEYIANYLGDCYGQDKSDCFMVEGKQVRKYRDPPDLKDSNDTLSRVRLLLVMIGMGRDFQTM